MNYNKELSDSNSLVLMIGKSIARQFHSLEALLIDGEYEEYFARNGYSESAVLYNIDVKQYTDPFPISYIIDYKNNIQKLIDKIEDSCMDETMLRQLIFTEDFLKFDHIAYICSYDSDGSSLLPIKSEVFKEMMSLMTSKMISYSPNIMNIVSDDYSICFNTSKKNDISTLKLSLDGNYGIKVVSLDLSSYIDKISLLIHYGIQI